MASLLEPVKSKLFISSTLKSAHPLDGGYASLVRGRSLDFDDLRPYEHGDEVRDIDWKATARMGEPMVKRSHAERRHTVLFAVDTGAAMRARARDEGGKTELAVLAVGALATLAVRHDDDVSLMHLANGRGRRLAPRRSEGGIEQLLRAMVAAIEAEPAASTRDELLRAVAQGVARRMILVVVTDEAPVSARAERELRRLRAQHDVVWLTLRDADPVLASRPRVGRRDAASGWAVPEFLHGSAEVVAELTEQRAADDAARRAVLDRLGISHVELDGRDTAVTALLRMLHGRAHAHR
ncbi:DUF58 domain-containing protein [Protaetiibacter intestinalis]|uniref:DUF58 domain-containing protein n=1 Tax=Protaetiibacter intestinalis TaxID=2419774 RepID=A0A387BF84_9MICO|nr:DUF58 domain-containing protein [Protaetiibacter intestinalis]AYF97150.1 DUF58 domain-containing protein [Protaetiibacter intestinalis]